MTNEATSTQRIEPRRISILGAVPTRSSGSHEEFLGRRTSYTYQLEALADSLRAGEPFGIDVDDAVASTTLVDQVYAATGFPLRGSG